MKLENMVRKIVKEELPQLNKGSQSPTSPAKVKSKKMESIRYVAQSFQSLVAELNKLETEGESSAGQSLEQVKKLVNSAKTKFLKEYVGFYK